MTKYNKDNPKECVGGGFASDLQDQGSCHTHPAPEAKLLPKIILNYEVTFDGAYFKETVKTLEKEALWSADMIVAPLILELFKRTLDLKQGVPHVDKDHVPKDIWKEPDSNGSFDLDIESMQNNWDYVSKEIIWFLETIDECFVKTEIDQRRQDASILFGYYFRCFWT